MLTSDTDEIAYPSELPDDLMPIVQQLDYPCSFLGGVAGTGKTYLARKWAESDPSVWLCASTGIAAVNLGTVTINATLWYFDTDDLEQKYHLGTLQAALRKLRASHYTRILLDEISMTDGRQLDLLTFALDEVNVGVRSGEEIGLTLCGDFAQLPPVKGQFCFERPSWARYAEHRVMLTEPRRQADPHFVRALQAVRAARVDEAMSYFGPTLTTREDPRFRGTTVVAKNEEVERINRVRLMDLPGVVQSYLSSRGGKLRSEWKHIPEILEVKPGAIVMLLANRYDGVGDEKEMIYANGDLAEYIGVEDAKTARVKLLRNDQEVVVPAIIRQYTQVTGHTGEKKPRLEVVGWIQYVPLRLAFASTVHKIQGLSLDHVQLLGHNAFWKQPSMLYVGLSRARSMEGLKMVCTDQQFRVRITVDPRVKEWL